MDGVFLRLPQDTIYSLRPNVADIKKIPFWLRYPSSHNVMLFFFSWNHLIKWSTPLFSVNTEMATHGTWNSFRKLLISGTSWNQHYTPMHWFKGSLCSVSLTSLTFLECYTLCKENCNLNWRYDFVREDIITINYISNIV